MRTIEEVVRYIQYLISMDEGVSKSLRESGSPTYLVVQYHLNAYKEILDYINSKED